MEQHLIILDIVFRYLGIMLLSEAYFDDDNGNNSGSAYIYKKDEGSVDNWGQIKKITDLRREQHLMNLDVVFRYPGIMLLSGLVLMMIMEIIQVQRISIKKTKEV